MSEMTSEQIAQWIRDNPITRAECTTFKATTPNGKVFVHVDMGVALSTQGRMGDTGLGKFVDSITESLDNQPATPG